MAQSTGPVLAIGAITLANESVFNDKPINWKIPVATTIAAVMFAGAERAVGRTAVWIAYLGLITICLVRTDPNTPSPAESALSWYEKR